MAMFPWDDWFYHISQKKQEVNDLYNQYLHLRDQLAANGGVFNTDLDSAQSMLAWNYALLLVASVAHMPDDKYAQWLQDHATDKPPEPQHSSVIEVFQGLTELFGTLEVGKFVWNVAVSAKDAIVKQGATEAAEAAEEDGEEMTIELLTDTSIDTAADVGINAAGDAGADAIAEAGTEAGVDGVAAAVGGASSAAMGVAATAGGIFIAVGIDAILGAIDGADEANQLDKAIGQLKTALATTQTYLDQLAKKEKDLQDSMVKQIQIFLGNMKLLIAIQPPTFTYDFTADFSNVSVAKVAMMAAATEYGFLTTIRDSWTKMHANSPTMTWDTFTMFMTMDRPTNMSEATAQAYLNYAATHMSDSMNKLRGA